MGGHARLRRGCRVRKICRSFGSSAHPGLDLLQSMSCLMDQVVTSHRNMVEKLRDNTGPNFDKSYIDYLITLNQQAVKLVNDAVEWVTDEPFKQFLREAAPELSSHLEAGQSIQRQLSK